MQVRRKRPARLHIWKKQQLTWNNCPVSWSLLLNRKAEIAPVVWFHFSAWQRLELNVKVSDIGLSAWLSMK